VEWVLTGEHWENGSEVQERPTPDLLEIACLFREISADGRERVDEALRIIQQAVAALREQDVGERSEGTNAMAAALRDHADGTMRILESAWRVQRAVLRQAPYSTMSLPVILAQPFPQGRPHLQRKVPFLSATNSTLTSLSCGMRTLRL